MSQVHSDSTPIGEHEQFLNCKEIAAFVGGVSEGYALKRLPGHRAGRRVLFLKSEVIAALGPAIIGRKGVIWEGAKIGRETATPQIAERVGSECDGVPGQTKPGLKFYDALKLSKSLMREQEGVDWIFSTQSGEVCEIDTDLDGHLTFRDLPDVRPEAYDDWEAGGCDPADPPGWVRPRVRTVWPPKTAAEDKKWDFFVAYPGDAVSTEFVVDAETREDAVKKIRAALLTVATIIEEHPTYTDEQMDEMRVKAGKIDYDNYYGNGEV